MRNVVYTVMLVIICFAGMVSAELDGPRSTDGLDRIYSADDILDGVDGWNQNGPNSGAAGDPGTEVFFKNAAGNLQYTTRIASGGIWMEQDVSPSYFMDNITIETSYTLEISIKMEAPLEGTHGTFVWIDAGGKGYVATIGNTGTSLAGDPDTDNTDGFHVFRVAYDATDQTLTYWRDGELLETVTASNPGGAQRLILGDGSSSLISGTVEYEYIAIDATGAYSPYNPVELSESEDLTEVAEGTGSDSYTITLNPDPNELMSEDETWPGSPVDVTITAGPEVLVNGAEQTIVTFPAWTGDPNDYTISVEVTAIDDDDIEGPETDVISHYITSADLRWDGQVLGDVVVDVIDDDGTPSVVLNTTDVTAQEGGSEGSYTVVLGTPPKSPVTIEITGDVQVVDPNDIIFDETNWATPQTVRIIAIDDVDMEPTPHVSVILHNVISADPIYDGMAVEDVAVSIVDDDTVGPTSVAAYAWYKADAGGMNGSAVAVDGEAISAWLDQTPNHRDLTNTSGGYTGPTYVSSYGDTSAATLAFGEDQHIWQSANVWGKQIPYPMTIIVAGTFGEAGHMHFVESSTGTGNFRYGQTASGKFDLDSIVSRWETVDSQFGKRTVTTALFDTTDSKHYLNGVLVGSGQALPADDGGLSGLMVGSFSTDFRGEIAELIFYNAELADEDRLEIEQYLMDKYMSKVFVFETANTTEVIEADGATEDTFDIQILGSPTAGVDVEITPQGPEAGNIDLGAGPGQSILVSLPGAGAETVTVTSIDNATSDGPREINIAITTTSTDAAYDGLATELVITVNDNEAWCGQPGTVYQAGDVNLDCYVDLADIAEMAAVWLQCTHPFYSDDCLQELP